MVRARLPIVAGVLVAMILLACSPRVNASSRQQPNANFPPDPTANIPSSPAGYASVGDVQAAFNAARATENKQLGLSIPMMTLPTQAAWNAMGDNARALWLINRERIDRIRASTPGLLPLDSAEANVTSIAQYYAQYLLSHNTFSHNADGHDPWQRLDTNPAINACHDFLGVAENLYVAASTVNSFPYPIEQAIYDWMYSDSGSGWGHRHAILWYPYNNNSGSPGTEGFLGMGRATGGPYTGPFTQQWPFATIIVMNVFDPCATWHYPAPRAFMPRMVAR